MKVEGSMASVRPQFEYEFRHNGEKLLHMLRQHHPDYHPIVSIARIAHSAELAAESSDDPDYAVALRAHALVLQYVEPSLKSVEVNLVSDEKRVINVSLFEELLEDDSAKPSLAGRSDGFLQILNAEVVDEGSGQEGQGEGERETEERLLSESL